VARAQLADKRCNAFDAWVSWPQLLDTHEGKLPPAAAHLGRVDKLEAAQELVQEKLMVVARQVIVRFNHLHKYHGVFKLRAHVSL
jgi:hypothetical protein